MIIVKRVLAIIVILALFASGITFFSSVIPTLAEGDKGDNLQENLTHQLRELTEGKARISTHAKTGKVRFIGTEISHPVPRQAALEKGANPEKAARGFLSTYGELFGLSDQARELTVMRSKMLDDGRSFVRFQQVYDGVPVVGGELIVQVSSARNIISANGETLPDISLDTTPTVAASSAQETALNVVVKEYGIDPDALRVSKPELWIYNPIILGMDWDMNILVWRMEVEPVEMLPICEQVLVDANLGVVALHFNQVATAKYRKVYDNQNNLAYGLPGNGPVRSEGQGPHSVADVNYAYDYAGDTYDFYSTYHGRDSIDDAGMNLISTVRYCDPFEPCPYDNAYWHPMYQQMVFGQGYASADDVVAHEMTHGVTSYESQLIYCTQSGAINEAFSDIWGEFVDLTNSAGNDDPSVRWLIGEDLPCGTIRDMSNPTIYGLPDKMTSTYYYCDWQDYGGVHYNCGVGCKAAYLMVDGDAFNGYTVTGMGISKTANVWYEVQTNLFTSCGDYADLYDCLQQAAINLGYDANDCQTVKDAVDATEMNLLPITCPAVEAPICDTGTPSNLWFDDLENPASGHWTSAAIQGNNEWYYPQIPNPYNFDATHTTSGSYNLWGYDQSNVGDYYIAMTSDVALPSGAYLHFNHHYMFETACFLESCFTFDGGVVEYSTNGGVDWYDAGALFTHNGYTGTIHDGSGNPLAGQSAFVGYSDHYISSRLDLSSLAGQNVRFRFRIGTDESVGDYGWFIDDIRIYTCEIPAPTITVNPTSFNVTLPSDIIQNYTLTVGNDGAANLTYSISDRETISESSQGDKAEMFIQLARKVLETPLENSPVEPRNTAEALGTWQTIMTEDFEGAFPGIWDAYCGSNSTDAYWGKDNYNSHSGSYSAFCAKNGTAGVDPPADYPDNMNAWMRYGPFSLADASDAELNFYWWYETDSVHDHVVARIFWFDECPNLWEKWGSNSSQGWKSESFDLGIFCCGQSEVWLLFWFSSDASGPDSGAFIDDVVLRKYVSGANNAPNTPSNPSPANHATGVSIDADLSWSGGDPDADDIVTYDVYFGTSSSPPLVSNNQSGTMYDPGALAYNTKYYWKIIATDNHAASTTGPLWDFTMGGVVGDCPWMDENPKSGSVPAGGSNNITVTINTTGLTVENIYTAEIVIANNDPDENPKVVPVTLHVVPTEVSISPPSQEVTCGDSFSVNVTVDPEVAIAEVQFDLSFDSSLITAVSVEEGNLLNQNGASTNFSPGMIDNDLGTITGMAGNITTAGETVFSPGVFAIINFIAKDAQGTSPLDLSNVMVGDINGDSVPITVSGGNVTIGKTGDVNNDDHVNVLDMVLIGQYWGQTGSPGWIPEDVIKDGVVNVLDMIIVSQHWTG